MFGNMKYVYEVYKERSFSKAATNLYISQPSLSATVKKIENRIGAPLFDRSTNPVQLTECGAEYIKCVERMIDIENGFANYVNDLNDLATGHLVIGGSNFFTSYILPPLITRFKAQYPRVVVKLAEADTARISQQLSSGALDLIIDNYEFDEKFFKKSFCYSEHLLFAARSDLVAGTPAEKYGLTTEDVIADRHLREDTPCVPMKLLENLPFVVLRTGNDTRMRAEKVFNEHHITPTIVMKLDQLATAFHIAYHGLGVTLLSDTLVKRIPPPSPGVRMMYFKFSGKHAQRDTYFFYKSNKYVSRSMEELLNMSASMLGQPG